MQPSLLSCRLHRSSFHRSSVRSCFMAGEEPDRAGGRADSVCEASKTVYLSCFARQSSFAVAVHETVCMSVCQPAFRLKISSAKSKQITHTRQIASCYLIYLETNALSELANFRTVISCLHKCITSRLLLMQPSRFKLSELHPGFIIRPPPPPSNYAV